MPSQTQLKVCLQMILNILNVTIKTNQYTGVNDFAKVTLQRVSLAY